MASCFRAVVGFVAFVGVIVARPSEKSQSAEMWYNKSIKNRAAMSMKYVEGQDREQMTLLPTALRIT
ncbi:hypothetical protein SDC9_82206 [bioreactor metagenome]|uniref:Uncharacterized protein n=1 Tax=bioreactor metagenome TaxID=1076179 RepID=A0A644ZA85_9ZZZZ